MRTEFIECETEAAARDIAPWAARIVAVEGGYHAFESIDDWHTWSRQAGAKRVTEEQSIESTPRARCVSDRYDNTGELYDSVDEFLDMCDTCFGERPNLIRCSEGWRDDFGLVLIEVASPQVTEEQIESLRDEAGVAGDLEQVELCRRALLGDESAWRACERAIAAAKAMES